MSVSLAHNWWSLLLRGAVAILLGLLIFIHPVATVFALVLLFSAYALVDGVVALFGAVRAIRSHERWGALLLEGIAGIGAAIVTWAWPHITALVLVWVIAAWAIMTGIFEIVAAIRLRKHIQGEWLLALAGVVSIVFGVVVIGEPLAGALVVALTVGAYACVFGMVMIALGLRLRSWSRRTATA
jgi:uncharacterized membrane protein HdeD (DUF308 family)